MTTDMYEFDIAAAVHERHPGVRRAELIDGWDIGGVPNGGYLLAVATRALLAESERSDPLTITCHYVRRARVGPVEITTETVGSGRKHTTATAMVRQDGIEVARVLGTFTDLDGASESLLSRLQPPSVPAPDDCVLVTPIPGHPQSPPPITAKVHLRLRPEDIGFALRRPHGRAEMIGWASFADGRPPDTSSLPLFADAFPPTIFNAGLPVGWMPTIELTVHVRRRPAPGHLLCAFCTKLVSGGYLEIDGDIFDSTGGVVAMSRQLAAVPRPPA